MNAENASLLACYVYEWPSKNNLALGHLFFMCCVLSYVPSRIRFIFIAIHTYFRAAKRLFQISEHKRWLGSDGNNKAISGNILQLDFFVYELIKVLIGILQN
ncbi:hypothetical protein B0I21_101366 [Sphingobacterium paludis]|uniref:Uncharacterized protein n=1 Tax=Sphingobacterium paludis TaxID=1476465 RepID=A0A4R7D8C5_9SPHI|nr:hypothetical protein B0I21_101366 [Sphingobacterium paludis]